MIGIKPQKNMLFIVFGAFSLLSNSGFSSSKFVTTRDLFKTLSPTEPWRKGALTATKTVNFEQSASGETDATIISNVTLAYFVSSECTGSKAGDGFYTTPNGTSFTISVDTPFGLVATSTWNVGATQLNIPDMTTINSIAVTLKSTNSNVPQANFSGRSFACIPVTCATNACTSVSGTQRFDLKTTAAVGDPADGGVIASLTGLIATSANDSTGIPWGGVGTAIGVSAQSPADGAANTTAIVGTIGVGSGYAAGLCQGLSITGGYTSGWFLPARDQLNTLYTNRVSIGGFSTERYWSSTEAASSSTHLAWSQEFFNGDQNDTFGKGNPYYTRCVRAFIP